MFVDIGKDGGYVDTISENNTVSIVYFVLLFIVLDCLNHYIIKNL